MSTGHRIPLAQAEALAGEWVARLLPHCDRVEIAGSIRRQVVDVGDLELVALPRMQAVFGLVELLKAEYTGFLTTEEREAYGSKRKDPDWVKATALAVAKRINRPVRFKGDLWPKARYNQLALPEGICMDLFMPVPEAWGLVFFIRTGSALFTRAMATQSAKRGYIWHEGRVYRRGKDGKGNAAPEGAPFPLDDEEAVFRHFGVRFVAPRDRTDEGVLWAAVLDKGAGEHRRPQNWRR